MFAPYKYLAFFIYEGIMGRLIDLTGEKFGRLMVIEKIGIAEHGGHAKWLCRCECGKTIVTQSNSLKAGKTSSCGCYRIEHAMKEVNKRTKHKLSNERLYSVWISMIKRCTNPKCDRYKDYGGRGITVCEEWKDDYLAFREWALKNGYDENAKRGECTIDRINNDGNYEPSNCRWVDMKTQSTNKRKRKQAN